MFYVYLLESRDNPDKHYIGYSTDLKKRIERHNKRLVRSTRTYSPWNIIFYEAYLSRFDAKRREKYLKTSPGRKALKLMLRYSLSKEENEI